MEQITREELYELVWSEPMLAVAKRFGVSSSYLARVCTRLNVPRPTRGYWAKLSVGKAPTQARLPIAPPGDELSWNPAGGAVNVSHAPALHAQIADGGVSFRNAARSNKEHPLLIGVEQQFLDGRVSQFGNYLKPKKRLLPDIIVTNHALGSALAFANQLFLALEKRGHRVIFGSISEDIQRAPVDTRNKPTKQAFHDNLWSPARNTVLYIGGTPIGLTIFELTESTAMRYVGGQHIPEADYVPPKSPQVAAFHWSSIQDIPSSRLCLQAYASCYDVKWVRQWKEMKQRDFAKPLAALVGELEASAPEVANAIEQGRQRGEAERARIDAMFAEMKIEEENRRRQKAHSESVAQLAAIVDAWAQHERAERFFCAIEGIEGTVDSDTHEKLRAKIEEARKLIGVDNTLADFLAWRSPKER